MMVFEHVALNVPDSRAMAAWYTTHCGLRIVHAGEGDGRVVYHPLRVTHRACW